MVRCVFSNPVVVLLQQVVGASRERERESLWVRGAEGQVLGAQAGVQRGRGAAGDCCARRTTQLFFTGGERKHCSRRCNENDKSKAAELSLTAGIQREIRSTQRAPSPLCSSGDDES